MCMHVFFPLEFFPARLAGKNLPANVGSLDVPHQVSLGAELPLAVLALEWVHLLASAPRRGGRRHVSLRGHGCRRRER